VHPMHGLTIEYSFLPTSYGPLFISGQRYPGAAFRNEFGMGSFQWKCVEYKEQNGFVIVNFSRRGRLQRRRYRIEQGSQETYALAQERGIQTNQGDWKSQVGCCALRAEVTWLRSRRGPLCRTETSLSGQRRR